MSYIIPDLKVIPQPNPFAKQIREKASTLETYQTPRTAKEFFDTIVSIFASQRIYPLSPLSSLFLNQRAHLIFNENEAELFEIVSWKRKTLKAVSYHLTDQQREIAVMALPAYEIFGLNKNIFLGRTRPRELMPFKVTIRNANDKQHYHIKYIGEIPSYGRIGFS